MGDLGTNVGTLARVDTPDVRYARHGGVAIAYQVVGEGGIDLVYVPDWMSNLVYAWEIPRWRAFYERLARSFRLILFDKRGLPGVQWARSYPRGKRTA